MMPFILNDTIAALATPPGEGGIAIIRISGNEALLVASKIFQGPIFSYMSHTVHLGKIMDMQGNIIDETLCLVMKAPKSFTGEDTVELHCHGGSVIAKAVLSLLIKAGARMARPGEFSLRAFMNGKIDLAQAEAIQHVISAKNSQALRAAEQQLQGALSHKILSFQKQLLRSAAILEAWVDFPEEGLEFTSLTELLHDIDSVQTEMQKLSDTFEEGKILQEGLTLCLSGPPNAGKSSLMNALLGKERAIVTDIPGTTRDLLEEALRLDDLHFRIIDTAGIRTTEELIEQEGIRRSKQAMQEADLVLLLFDGTNTSQELCQEFLATTPQERTLIVFNKKDLSFFNPPCLSCPSVHLSAMTGDGLEQLKRIIYDFIWKKGPPSHDEVLLSSHRHKQALDRSIEHLIYVKQGLQEERSPELLCFDIRRSLFELGTIIGMNVPEEILSTIFSTFCVGK